MSVFSDFRGQHFASPDPTPLDITEDTRQDPNDDEDFELPDQQALFDAFMDGLSKESDTDFRGLSSLLATLPDPSLSHAEVEAMSITDARELGLIPEASDETLQAFSYSDRLR